MCIIPYGTQQGEISFCAYNTGVGWRQIIENMHKTASTAEWFKKIGRHKIYAGGKSVPLPVLNGDAHPVPAGVGCGSSANAAMPSREHAAVAASSGSLKLLKIRA
jgi:hypothetical protein